MVGYGSVGTVSRPRNSVYGTSACRKNGAPVDGEADALHRQLHHDGCAVVTRTTNHGLADNRGVLSPGEFIARTIITRADWNSGQVTVYTDGAVVVLGAAEGEN